MNLFNSMQKYSESYAKILVEDTKPRIVKEKILQPLKMYYHFHYYNNKIIMNHYLDNHKKL